MPTQYHPRFLLQSQVPSHGTNKTTIIYWWTQTLPSIFDCHVFKGFACSVCWTVRSCNPHTIFAGTAISIIFGYGKFKSSTSIKKNIYIKLAVVYIMKQKSEKVYHHLYFFLSFFLLNPCLSQLVHGMLIASLPHDCGELPINYVPKTTSTTWDSRNLGHQIQNLEIDGQHKKSVNDSQSSHWIRWPPIYFVGHGPICMPKTSTTWDSCILISWKSNYACLKQFLCFLR